MISSTKKILHNIFNLDYRLKLTIALFTDFFIIFSSLLISNYIVSDKPFLPNSFYAILFILMSFSNLLVFFYYEIYNETTRFIKLNFFLKLIITFFINFLINFLLIYFVEKQFDQTFSKILTILNFFISFFLIFSSRLIVITLGFFSEKNKINNILIIGTDNETLFLSKKLATNFLSKIYFLHYKKNTNIKNKNYFKNILTLKNLKDNIKRKKITRIYCLNSKNRNFLNYLLKSYYLNDNKIKFFDLNFNKNQNLFNLQSKQNSLKINEILERSEYIHNYNEIPNAIKNDNILITGAGGSIGSKLSKIILKNSNKNLIIMDISEASLFQTYNDLNFIKHNEKINNKKIIPIVADIRDIEKISFILNNYKIGTVFNAAAYKHVHLMELNEVEAFKTNVVGVENLVLACQKNNVKKIIQISTDKAVRYTNIMGGTKFLAEQLLTYYSKKFRSLNISVVRFGNVIGSSGSVLPIFLKQIELKVPLTVTSKKVTRYFMSIKEACELVLIASSYSVKGKLNLFVLDMGKPLKIYELAKKLLRDHGYNSNEISRNIVITGLKKGEKMHEELSYNKNLKPTLNNKIYSITESNTKVLENIKMYRNLKRYLKLKNNEKILRIKIREFFFDKPKKAKDN
jgi:UDP-N-acetylglucosamine 4,6-dehydratase